ncbi:unnamed protein product [Psylliodes chrysocephalus]|uniref:Uncharacterized protein n=1 Tax=Psylliodes chrysocephalus TaxID=3402493 RepID=A0A9P0CQV8_9CUCU|nr:unnamed protein product [Psylliodes chrysocephala]
MSGDTVPSYKDDECGGSAQVRNDPPTLTPIKGSVPTPDNLCSVFDKIDNIEFIDTTPSDLNNQNFKGYHTIDTDQENKANVTLTPTDDDDVFKTPPIKQQKPKLIVPEKQ